MTSNRQSRISAIAGLGSTANELQVVSRSDGTIKNFHNLILVQIIGANVHDASEDIWLSAIVAFQACGLNFARNGGRRALIGWSAPEAVAAGNGSQKRSQDATQTTRLQSNEMARRGGKSCKSSEEELVMVVVVERRAAAVLRAVARGEPALWLTVNMTRRKACIPTTRESG